MPSPAPPCDPVAYVGEPAAEDRPDEADHDAERQGHGGDDRHEPAAAEEREPGRQLDPVVPLVQQRGDDTHQDAAEHVRRVLGAPVDDLRLCPVRHLGDEDVALQFVGVREHDLGDPVEDQVADHGGERRGAVGLLGEADRHTDGEEQRQRGEQRALPPTISATRSQPGRPRRACRPGRSAAAGRRRAARRSAASGCGRSAAAPRGRSTLGAARSPLLSQSSRGSSSGVLSGVRRGFPSAVWIW